MLRAIRKFIAVILAVWLPVFGGNALAMSVAMQSAGADCHATAAQQDESHCAPAVQQHAHHVVADQDRSSTHQGHAGDDCGACHLAGCGYLAAARIEVTGSQPSALVFLPVSTQFKSITSAPLDPPPLVRS